MRGVTETVSGDGDVDGLSLFDDFLLGLGDSAAASDLEGISENIRIIDVTKVVK